MQKAEETAKQLGHDQFESSEGCFKRWKKRHDLRHTKLYGEASEADEEAADMRTNENMQELLKKYEPSDIYNADETLFCFRVLPDSTYVKKSSRKLARGSKIAKDRLTALVCCNLIDDKHGLLVIGTSHKPRCFKNVRAFPADYSFSKNAWITNGIWSDWLRKWDRSLCFQQRKIALLVDNCYAHGDVEELKCIEVMRLPPNTTSLIQPCDMGIIRTLKVYCRHQIRARIIDAIEDGCNDSSINANTIAKRLSVLDALHILAGSWNKLTNETICYC